MNNKASTTMNDINESELRLNFKAKLRQTKVKTFTFFKTKGLQNAIIMGVALGLFLIFTIISPGFAEAGNIRQMSMSLAPYAVLGLGVTFVIATGGIDLSIGTVCMASAVIGGKLYDNGLGLPMQLVIPVILIVGTLFGLLNGFLVAKLKLPPFIATLGVMMFSRGVSAVFAGMPNIKFPIGTWYLQMFANWNGFPVGILWIIGLGAICMYVMYKCKVGRYILAIGSNEEAARLSGIKTDKYKIFAYTICGLFAGMAAIFFSAANPTVTSAGGSGWELDAIAGVYIGGTSATGGVASITGSIFGAIILVLIRMGLTVVLTKYSIPVNSTYMAYLITGVIVVAAVLLDVVKNKAATKVKTEKKAAKFKDEIKSLIEQQKIKLDYLLSDKKTTEEDKSSGRERIMAEIKALKRRLASETPKFVKEDEEKAMQIKATKLAAKHAAKDEKN